MYNICYAQAHWYVYFLPSTSVNMVVDYTIGSGPKVIMPDAMFTFEPNRYFFPWCMIELSLIERWTDCDTSNTGIDSGYNCDGNPGPYITSYDPMDGSFTIDTSNMAFNH